MKLLWIFGALTAIVFGLPVAVQADDLATRLAGTYSCKETNYLTVKRLTFTAEKNGTIKIRGALVGFPEEVSLGEATAEAYSHRNDKENFDRIIATFSSDKYKPLMLIQPASPNDKHNNSMAYTCYMRDVDGSRVHFNGYLQREP